MARIRQTLIDKVDRFKQEAIDREQEELAQIQAIRPEVKNKALTSSEEKERLEARTLKAEIIQLISDFFVTLGEKLKIYQEKRLYRFEAETFGSWCEQEIGIKRNYAYKMIRAYDIYVCLQKELCTIRTQKPKTNNLEQNHNIPLPNSEYQIRALARLPQDQWFSTWVEAISQSENKNKPPSGKLVEQIVKEKKKMQKVDPHRPKRERFKVTDLVRITAKYNEDLKQYHSCWGEVVSAEEHSYNVLTWKGKITAVAHDDRDAFARRIRRCCKESTFSVESIENCLEKRFRRTDRFTLFWDKACGRHISWWSETLRESRKRIS